MELTDLQKAAFGPTLFNRRMKRLQGSSDGNIPTLRPRETKFPNPLVSTISKLIPGGRYLLTGASLTGSITLWDLAFAGPFYRVKSQHELLDIAKCTLDQSRFFMKNLTPLTPRPGQRTLQFIATVLPQDAPQTQLSVSSNSFAVESML